MTKLDEFLERLMTVQLKEGDVEGAVREFNNWYSKAKEIIREQAGTIEETIYMASTNTEWVNKDDLITAIKKMQLNLQGCQKEIESLLEK